MSSSTPSSANYEPTRRGLPVTAAPLLELQNLSTRYVSAQGTRVVRAVDDVSLRIHAGETLVVTRIDRLARSLRDLQVIVDRLKSKGAHLLATEQPVDTATATGKAFFDMLGVFAEFETNLRRERQAEGIAAAKTRGVYKGRPPKIDRAEIWRRLQQGHGPTKIAHDLGISRGTVYQVRTGIPE